MNQTIQVGKGKILGVDIWPFCEHMCSAVDYSELHGRIGHPHNVNLTFTAQALNLE